MPYTAGRRTCQLPRSFHLRSQRTATDHHGIKHSSTSTTSTKVDRKFRARPWFVLPHLPHPPFSPSYGFSSLSSVFTSPSPSPRRSRHFLPRRRPPARAPRSGGKSPPLPQPTRRAGGACAYPTARLLPPLPRPAAIRAVDPR